MSGFIHIRNGRDRGSRATLGVGSTWCGKKLLAQPEKVEEGVETFCSYGNVVRATLDPAGADCPHCRAAFDAAYNAAFPEGPKPIATFRADDPDAKEKLRSFMADIGIVFPAEPIHVDGGGANV